MSDPSPTRRRRSRRPVAPVVAALLAIAALGAPGAVLTSATAAPTPTPTPTTKLPNYDSNPQQQTFATWSLVPIGADGGLDGRTKFDYTVAPGAKVVDRMGVSNFSVKPLRLEIYATDAINTADGQFGLLAAGDKPKDLGSWITTKRTVVTVPARARYAIPFTLTVPANATPGDHVAGIVATAVQAETGNKTQQLGVNFRTGSRVYVRVTGALKPSLAIENLHASYRGTLNPFGRGTATVTYRVHNTGNVRLAAGQKVKVSTSWGMSRSASALDPLPELLPGQSADVSTTVTGVVPALRLKATATLDPVVPVSVSSPSVTPVWASTWFWAVPWTLIALVVGLLVLWRLELRRRRSAIPGAHSSRRRTPEGAASAADEGALL